MHHQCLEPVGISVTVNQTLKKAENGMSMSKTRELASLHMRRLRVADTASLPVVLLHVYIHTLAFYTSVFVVVLCFSSTASEQRRFYHSSGNRWDGSSGMHFKLLHNTSMYSL